MRWDWRYPGKKKKPKRSERKKELAQYRYRKTWEKWYCSEPPRWRVVSHLVWRHREPPMPNF